MGHNVVSMNCERDYVSQAPVPTSKPPSPSRANYRLERITRSNPFNHPLNRSLTPISALALRSGLRSWAERLED